MYILPPGIPCADYGGYPEMHRGKARGFAMKKGFWKLAGVAGFIALGTVTAEAMEMNSVEPLPNCALAQVGQSCTLDLPGSESPEKIEVGDSSPQVLEIPQIATLSSSPEAPGETVTWVISQSHPKPASLSSAPPTQLAKAPTIPFWALRTDLSQNPATGF